MKKLNKAFTLIELIVGITISMLLMVSVGIFVNNGMANILTQQKVIKNTTELTDFTSNLHTAINLMSTGTFIPQKTASGIIFKREKNLGDGGFSYIGTENLDKIYCESGSEDTITKHILLKNFIPFEEHNSDGTNENIFNNYSGSLISKIEIIGSNYYQSLQKKHVIIDKNGNTVIGKGIFGNKINGTKGTDIYLNSPTGLSHSGNILFISDTLNNRILYYNTISKNINILLDESDGLNEPTGLYYNNTEKALYIGNSGNGEILKYSSKSISTPELTMSGFSENINKIEVSFPSNNLTNTGNFSFIPNYSGNHYLTGTTKTLKYYLFSKNTESNQPTCNGTEIKFDTVDTYKPKIYCTKNGSGQTLNYPTNINIQKIKINNLTNFSATGSYYINLKVFNNSTEKDLGYFPFFTKSDDDLTTPDDNTLEVIKSGLKYPTGLWWDGTTIQYNEFGNRAFTNLTLDNNPSDIILKTPINYLKTYINNGLVTFFLKYYKKYNCYNLDDKSERTYLIKKNLK